MGASGNSVLAAVCKPGARSAHRWRLARADAIWPAMLRLLSWIHLAYIGLFAAACVGVFIYQATYVWPVQRCEAHGGWWSDRYRICATPMPIWRITGRRPGAATAPRSAPGR